MKDIHNDMLGCIIYGEDFSMGIPMNNYINSLFKLTKTMIFLIAMILDSILELCKTFYWQFNTRWFRFGYVIIIANDN